MRHNPTWHALTSVIYMVGYYCAMSIWANRGKSVFPHSLKPHGTRIAKVLQTYSYSRHSMHTHTYTLTRPAARSGQTPLHRIREASPVQ